MDKLYVLHDFYHTVEETEFHFDFKETISISVIVMGWLYVLFPEVLSAWMWKAFWILRIRWSERY